MTLPPLGPSGGLSVRDHASSEDALTRYNASKQCLYPNRFSGGFAKSPCRRTMTISGHEVEVDKIEGKRLFGSTYLQDSLPDQRYPRLYEYGYDERTHLRGIRGHSPMLPARANFQAGAFLPAPTYFLLSSYAQKRHIE